MSLVAWYKFDGDLKDATGHGYDAVASGGSFSTAGRIGGCYDFSSASSNYVYVSNFPTSNIASFAAWGKSYGNGRMLFSCGAAGGNTWGPDLFPSGYMLWNTGDGGNNPFKLAGTSVAIPSLNVWHHYVVTNDYNQNKTNLYIDGIYTGTALTFKDTFKTSQTFIIGNFSGDKVWAWNGLIDDFRIYDHVLSEYEIRKLYQAEVLHLNFDTYSENNGNLIPNAAGTLVDMGFYVARSNEYVDTVIYDGNQRLSGKANKISSATTSYGSWSYSVFPYSYTRSVVSSVVEKYTGSCYVYVSPDCNISWARIEVRSPSFGATSYDLSKKGTWQRLSYTCTTAGDGSYVDFYYYLGLMGTEANPVTDLSTLTGYILFAFPQLLKGDHSKPFTSESAITGVVYDSSGYENHGYCGTIEPTWVPGKVGPGAYDFTLPDSYLEVPYSSTLDLCEEVTLSAWLKSTTTTNHVVIEKSSVNTHYQFQTANLNQGETGPAGRIMFLSNTGSSTNAVISTISIADNAWHHVVGTLKNLEAKLYIDGELNATKTVTANPTSNTSPLRIGQRNGLTEGGYVGYMDDIRIFATALSAEDVRQLYQSRGSIDSKGSFHSQAPLKETKYKPLQANYTVWQDGQTGAVTPFTLYGTTSENDRAIRKDPWGKDTVVWRALGAGDTDSADGGVFVSHSPIDTAKLYRYSIWFRSVRRETNGYMYFGARTGGYVRNLSDSSANTNPYFFYTTNPGEGNWLLMVGHIFPHWHTGTSMHPDSGRYSVAAGKYADIIMDFKWLESATYGHLRTFLYANTSGTTEFWWCYPRVDVCDGTEPSIAELLSGYDSRNEAYFRSMSGTKAQPLSLTGSHLVASQLSEVGVTNGLCAWYPLREDAQDISGNGYHGTVNGTTFESGIHGPCYKLTTTSTDNIILPNSVGYTTEMSVFAWIKRNGAGANSYCTITGPQECELSIYTVTSEFRNGVYTTSRYVSNSGAGVLTTGGWHHVGMTFSYNPTTTAGVKIAYIDGVKMDEVATTGLLTSSVANRTIGKYGTSVTYGNTFSITDLRFYNRPLSEAEVKILYEMTRPDSDQRMIANKDSGVYIKGSYREI